MASNGQYPPPPPRQPEPPPPTPTLRLPPDAYGPEGPFVQAAPPPGGPPQPPYPQPPAPGPQYPPPPAQHGPYPPPAPQPPYPQPQQRHPQYPQAPYPPPAGPHSPAHPAPPAHPPHPRQQPPYGQPPFPQQPPYPGPHHPQQAPGPYQQPGYPAPPHRAPQPPPPRPPAPPRGPYGPPYPHAVPRRKPGGGAGAGFVIGALFGTLALAFVLVVIVAALLDSAGDPDSLSPLAIPTYTPPTYTPPSDDPPTPRSREDDSSDRQEREERERPDTQVRLNTSLQNNTLYQAGALPTVKCPAGSANIYSHAQLKALILKTSKCMDAAWSRTLEKEGIDWRAPGWAIAAKRGRGACGDYPSPGSIVPYYCPRNETIYASTSAMARGSGRSLGYGGLTSWHGGIISMMAHEYGHHVQQLSGLTDSWWRKTLDSTSSSGRLALSRRFELQATCLGGMFMRSVSATYPVTPARRETLYYFYSRVGDHPGYPRDHGTPANNNRWFRQGYEKNKTHQCNTWLAPSNTTS